LAQRTLGNFSGITYSVRDRERVMQEGKLKTAGGGRGAFRPSPWLTVVRGRLENRVTTSFGANSREKKFIPCKKSPRRYSWGKYHFNMERKNPRHRSCTNWYAKEGEPAGKTKAASRWWSWDIQGLLTVLANRKNGT